MKEKEKSPGVTPFREPTLAAEAYLICTPAGRVLFASGTLKLMVDEDLTGRNLNDFLEDALAACPEDTFVIGGESVYTAALDRCDVAYVTKIAKAFQADRYFPDLDADPAWEIVEEEGPFQHEDLTFTYVTYKRT